MTLGLNKHPTYIELLQAFPPRPIKTEEELFATQKIIDSLIDSAPLTEFFHISPAAFFPNSLE